MWLNVTWLTKPGSRWPDIKKKYCSIANKKREENSWSTRLSLVKLRNLLLDIPVWKPESVCISTIRTQTNYVSTPHTAHSFLVPKGWSALSWRDNGEAGRTEDQYHYWLWAAHSGRTWRALRRASRARHDMMPSFLKKMSWDMKSCKDQDWIVHLFFLKKSELLYITEWYL